MKKYDFSEYFNAAFYVSSQCHPYQAAKTIFLLPPDDIARSAESLHDFAEETGWIEIAEKDAAVLVIPRAINGWEKEPTDRLPVLFKSIGKEISSNFQGDVEMDKVWLWETLVYIAAYREGADFAGDTLVAFPGYFAAAALIDGAPKDYAPGELLTDHHFVKTVTDYSVKNREVPSCVWLFGEDKTAISYFRAALATPSQAIHSNYDGIRTVTYQAEEPAQQVRVTAHCTLTEKERAQAIFNTLFNRVIRWKNAPDGTLKEYIPKHVFDSGEQFVRRTVEHHGYTYAYFIRRPLGAASAAGLPVVFSLHGRYEPSWLFSTKNGWDRLCDETKAFVLVLIDSPHNMWYIDRDGGVFEKVIDRLAQEEQIDRERVYLTGFSMGSACTCWAGTQTPRLFAGISPWNGPCPGFMDDFLESGLQMPVFAVDGDNDHGSWKVFDKRLEFMDGMLRANGCRMLPEETDFNLRYRPDGVRTQENYYTPENGYTDGERFRTYVFRDAQQRDIFAYTIMKNMPHGAVYDESRAAWNFLKEFRRLPDGSIQMC